MKLPSRAVILSSAILLAAFLLPSCGNRAALPAGVNLSGSYIHPKTGAVVTIGTDPAGRVSGSLSVPLKDANGNTVGTVDLTSNK